jgi:metal-responsive CopG/Arc/MetJ family transcriptional regulator
MSSVKVTLIVKDSLLKLIDEFMESEHITERSEAVRRLTVAGYKYSKLASEADD